MGLLDNCYISFVNLDHRTDRLDHMNNELNRVGLKSIRQRAYPWRELNFDSPEYKTMLDRTPGAIGCHVSQCEVMKKAFEVGSHAFVMEDDLIFCDDFHLRLDQIESFMNNNEWDVFWLGGTFHICHPDKPNQKAYWHPIGNSGMNPNCSAHIGRDFEHTDEPRIKRTYGAFSTYAYIVNYNSIQKILELLDKHIHESIGIDWLFIKLQPKLKCYAFVPGSVRQMDNISDIGSGMTIFSGFSKLNGTEENSRYWFQKLMTDFQPETFNWQ